MMASGYLPILKSVAIFKEISEGDLAVILPSFDPLTNLLQDLTEEVTCLKV